MIICYKHFRASDFKGPIDTENSASCHFPRLNTSAVPSLHLPGLDLEAVTHIVSELQPDLDPKCEPFVESNLSNNPIIVVHTKVHSVVVP